MLTYEYVNRLLDDVGWIKAKRNDYMCNTNDCVTCKNNHSGVEMGVSIASGAIAGVMSWVLVIPFDVMKTIMQAESDPEKHRNLRNLLRTKKSVRVKPFHLEISICVFDFLFFFAYDIEIWLGNIFSWQLDVNCAILTGECSYILG